jgi:hypothetical protein
VQLSSDAEDILAVKRVRKEHAAHVVEYDRLNNLRASQSNLDSFFTPSSVTSGAAKK